MSCYQEEGASEDRGRRRKGSGRSSWRPIEMAAMVAGFALYWPVGLAILALKLWQRREGHSGDLVAFAQDRFTPAVQAQWDRATSGLKPAWGGFSQPASSGNVAFDEWRARELARLEEERQKLANAQHEFAAHLERLRRARDREEFDRFMQERATAQTTQV